MIKATSTQFESLKEKMIKRGASTEYLTPEVLDIILNDRINAAEILLKNGNIQSFFKKSPTIQTEFYKKNSCAYCVLLEILESMKTQYIVGISLEDYGGVFEENVIADNPEQAKILGLKSFYENHSAFKKEKIKSVTVL